MKTISVIRLFIIYMLAACTISCNSNVPSLEEPKDTAPHLNESDSLAMVNIYKKIGPWGYDWDLKDIHKYHSRSGTPAFPLSGLKYNPDGTHPARSSHHPAA